MLNDYLKIIDEMIAEQETESMDDKILNTGKRNLRMAAIINDYLNHAANAEIIVTGGLSVEFYTNGGYTTQDIDFISPEKKELPKILTDLGFKNHTESWEHEKLEMILEMVATTPFDGTYKTPLVYTTEDGYQINIVDVNDILIDRIKGLVQWKYKRYSEWILALIEKHEQELDFQYLTDRLEAEELKVLEEYIQIAHDKTSFYSKQFYIKEFLDSRNIVYSDSEDKELYYFVFPLNDPAKADLGPYIGLLIEPYLALMMYNIDEETFEPIDVAAVGELLLEFSHNYGEPFQAILEILTNMEGDTL